MMLERGFETSKACLLSPIRNVFVFGLLVVAGTGLGVNDPVQEKALGKIRIGPDLAVRSTDPKAAHVEPYIAAHPQDPDHLVGTSIQWSRGEDSRCIVMTSFDAGKSWSPTVLDHCSVDPWVAFAADGTVYASCLSFQPDEPGPGAVTLVYRSTDGGRTWAGPILVPPGTGGSTDRPFLVPGRGSEGSPVYVVAGHAFDNPRGHRRFGPGVSVSTEEGRRFTAPKLLELNDLANQPLDGVTLPKGDVVLLFVDYATDSRIEHRRTWLVRVPVLSKAVLFAPPTLVFEQRGSEMPYGLASDGSGTSEKLVTVVDAFWASDPCPECSEDQPRRSQISVIVSEDAGETWSEPIFASEAKPGVDRATPSVAVNRQGIIGVSWYETYRESDELCFDVYFTASADGGLSFLPAHRVTTETSCPFSRNNPAGRWPAGGDYSGLTAAADGSFHLFWADSRSGVYHLRTARAMVKTVDTTDRLK